MMRHIRKTFFRVGLLLCCIIAAPQGALAHAFPDHSEPRVGSTVESSPAAVRIWFDGALESAFTTLEVLDVNGGQVNPDHGHVAPDDPTLLETELPPLPPGTYRVIWKVLARDGHRTEGDYTFKVK